MDEKPGNERKASGIAVAALIVSLAAVLAAFGSLGYAVFQDSKLNEYRRLQDSKLDEYRRLAIEPIIALDRILSPTQGYDGVGVYIRNVGNGIAKIQTGSITYTELLSDHPAGLLARIAEVIAAQNPGFPLVSAVGPRFSGVMQAGNKMLLLGIDAGDFTPEVGSVLREYIFRIGIKLEYRSLDEEAPSKVAELLPLSGSPP